MERLKEYYNADIGKRYLIHIPKEKDCIYIAGYKIDGFDSFESFCEYMKRFHDVEKELKAYEDLEEQGLLLRLPCKVGDYVYSVEWNGIARYIVSDFDVCMKSIYAYQGDYFIGEMGYKVFATKAEAEKKLAEMGE